MGLYVSRSLQTVLARLCPRLLSPATALLGDNDRLPFTGGPPSWLFTEHQPPSGALPDKKASLLLLFEIEQV